METSPLSIHLNHTRNIHIKHAIRSVSMLIAGKHGLRYARARVSCGEYIHDRRPSNPSARLQTRALRSNRAQSWLSSCLARNILNSSVASVAANRCRRRRRHSRTKLRAVQTWKKTQRVRRVVCVVRVVFAVAST